MEGETWESQLHFLQSTTNDISKNILPTLILPHSSHVLELLSLFAYHPKSKTGPFDLLGSHLHVLLIKGVELDKDISCF